MILYPFQPQYGTAVTYVTGASAALTNLVKGCRQVCVTNKSTTVPAYVRIASPGNATIADQIINPGAQVVLTKDGDTVVGQIFSASPGDVHVICGNGN